MTRSIVLPYLLAVSLLLAAPLAQSALKPSHEADRLIMAAQDAIAANDFDRAEGHLDRARGLGVRLPPEFDFFYARILQQNNELENARSHLERYVDGVGADGDYYREALALITQIERRRSGVSQQPAVETSQRTADIRWSDDKDKHLEELKTLYETEKPTEALVLHINNLLKFYAYGDQRIIAASRMGTPTRHRIHISDRGEIVSMNRRGADTEPFTEDRFPVYGINPYVDHDCQSTTGSCWLLHPVTSAPWLQIVQNEEVATELSRAFAQLIREMQKSR
ncbi:tetratricopeptide repeat protein [Gilvimarinus sp. F26214L]|uniref:tetratricopeptide repeat protein n=1 Tax=Gilvimarinus sp. DZF01 TaxID=3461371 RepID=UPI004046580B